MKNAVFSVLDLLHTAAAVIDRSGKVQHANARLESIVGLPRGLLAGRDIRALYRDPAKRAELDFLLQVHGDAAAAASRAPREDEFFLPGPGGARVPVVFSASSLPPPDEDLRIITFADITRVKEAESSLREHFAYVSQLSDTALEQAIALKHQTTQAQAEADELRDKAQHLARHSRELETVNRELERRVLQRTAELRQANVDAIHMLAVASEAKDHDTGAHVRRIRGLAERTARVLGFNEAESYEIGLAAVLHDVGKIHVPDAILTKPGPLTSEERTVMEQHTLWGQRILPDRPFFQRARSIARNHHEHFDGSGYPDSLSGLAIPIEARIVHAVDVYDALASPRVYKAAWPPEKALTEITDKTPAHFDPDVTKALQEGLVESR